MIKGGDKLIIEVCDLCKKPVDELHKTEVVVKDYKGVGQVSLFTMLPKKRKFKGIICDDCLAKLRGKEIIKHWNIPEPKTFYNERGGLKNIYETTVPSTEPEDN